MVKRTQTIRRQKPMNSLIVFDHFVGLELKGLSANPKKSSNTQPMNCLSEFDHFVGLAL